MKRTRTSISVILAVGLLAGSSTIATAQQDVTDPSAPAWVTGTIRTAGPGCTGPVLGAPIDGAEPERERHECTPQTWTTDDPRLSGTSTSTWVNDVYVLDEAVVSVSAGTLDLRNDAGGWLCVHADQLYDGMGRFASPINEQTVTCIGNREYDGLTAILALDWSSRPVPVSGLIFAGEAPPLPEPGAE